MLSPGIVSKTSSLNKIGQNSTDANRELSEARVIDATTDGVASQSMKVAGTGRTESLGRANDTFNTGNGQ